MEPADHFTFLLPAIMVVLSAVFFAAAWFGPLSAVLWGAGYLMSGLGFAAPFLPVSLFPVKAQALLADAMFLLACLCYAQAIRIRFRRPRRLAAHLTFGAFAYALIAYAVLGWNSQDAELLIGDLVFAALLLAALLSALPQARSGFDRLLILAGFLVASDTLLRTAIFAAIGTQGSFEDFGLSAYAFVMQTTSTILALLFALAALGAMIGDVIAEHRDASERDPLTGLLNRRGFEAVTRTRKAKGGCLVLCDIDHFKRINDRRGHVGGDRVLSRLGRIILDRLPPDGTAARFGGEEFVVFLGGWNEREGAAFAEMLREAIETTGALDDMAEPITASFGVAVHPPGDAPLDEALALADSRLYAAKAGGRNRVAAGEASTEAPMRLRDKPDPRRASA